MPAQSVDPVVSFPVKVVVTSGVLVSQLNPVLFVLLK